MIERTLVLIKPDGVQRGLIGEIIKRFEQRGLKIVGMKMVWVDKKFAERHYAVHKGKPFFNELIDFIVIGPVIAMVIEGEESVSVVRKMAGAAKPQEAILGTIRGDFAHTLPAGGRNLVHTSGTKEEAKSEIALWFNEIEIHSYACPEEIHTLGK